jgi:hypothetical protein
MSLKLNAKVALAAAGIATLGLGVFPSAALAQGPGYDQHYRGASRDYHRQYYSDRARGRYASRHCGSGNGAVGTIAGGAGGALLGNALGAEQPERLLVVSLVRWSEGLSIRRTHVTITRCATVADDKAAI